MAQFTQEGDLNFNLSNLSPKKIGIGAIILVFIISLYSSFYTIEANENGVILRFGKHVSTTTSGLHFKMPFGIDKVYKVKVDYQYKMEFGFRTSKAGKRTEYSNDSYINESWMLTGDLNIAEVHWVVQYKVKDPKAYLFNVRDVENTIRDVSEAIMQLAIGDRSFQETLQSERKHIAELSLELMQKILDSYEAGISVQLIQLKEVIPPKPVADSFNEVNRAKQEQEASINEARQAYNKEIYRVEGEAERLIAEAEGYAIERVNTAKGDAALFNAVLKEYRKSPQITKDRLYLETMSKIYENMEGKVIVDKRLKNVLPLLNIENKIKKR